MRPSTQPGFPVRRTTGRPPAALALAALLVASGCAPAARNQKKTASGVVLDGPLIPARTTMVTAWEVPQNPLGDPTLDKSPVSEQVRLGFRIFTNTPGEAGRYTGSGMSCNNCHMNAGQRDRGLPLVGIAGMFPEYNKRSGRLFALTDRVLDCFLRSENATGLMEGADPASEAVLPTSSSKEVLAVTAYITWLARGSEVGANPKWRGQNAVPAAGLVPVKQLDAARGEALFGERCVSCHGIDGQGVAVGDKKPGPLWGPRSWNDGAGAARVYTLAGMIRYSMPYLDPGSLTDDEAQQLAAFIDSKPRPSYPFKDLDYRTDKLPPDSVYYSHR